MKTIYFILIILGSSLNGFSQHDKTKSFTYGEFSSGYGISIFGKGLKERYEAGNYSLSGGGVYCFGAYKKVNKINHLNFGLKFKALGAAPASNNKGNEMFFNYWGAALSTKYYPFNKQTRGGLVFNVDYVFITQFTQKYRNEETAFYDHQFAIGSGIGSGVGYEFDILKTGYLGCLALEYQFDSRTGEVNNIGSKTFLSQSIAIKLGFLY